MSLPGEPTIRAIGNLPVTVLLSLLMAFLIFAYWDDQREDRLEGRIARQAQIEDRRALAALFQEIAKQSQLQTDLYKLKLESLNARVETMQEQNLLLRKYIEEQGRLRGN